MNEIITIGKEKGKILYENLNENGEYHSHPICKCQCSCPSSCCLIFEEGGYVSKNIKNLLEEPIKLFQKI